MIINVVNQYFAVVDKYILEFVVISLFEAIALLSNVSADLYIIYYIYYIIYIFLNL